MLVLVARRFGSMILVMLVVSMLTFLALEADPGNVATKVLGPYSTEQQRDIWMERNGYNDPLPERYLRWLGNFLQGDFGESTRFRTDVADVLWPRLGNTAILAVATMALVIPLSLVLGVLAGMREGSATDRTISVVSIFTTSIPEIASAPILTFIFVFLLGILPGTSSFQDGFSITQLILPTLVLVLYDFGYVTRMTRASMAEVMTTNYIRTATLKGLPYRRIIVKHALRNALIAPFTVVMLQINWLLSGVIVVELFFAYKGFGALLLEAALNQDIYVIEACAMIAVFVAVGTQALSDIGYTVLNPRIRFN
ncbi:MAG: ABC transporter permease [Pseudomonadota bacterium]